MICTPTVSVAEPWERITFVPPNSFVRINCTVKSNERGQWHFVLPGENSDSVVVRHFDADVDVRILHSNGFYELPLVQSEATKTIRVIINGTDTQKNNTRIQCIASTSGTRDVNETTLIVFGEYIILIICDQT